MELVEKYREIILQVFREYTGVHQSLTEIWKTKSSLTVKQTTICGWLEDTRNTNEFTPVSSALILSMEGCGFNTTIPKASRQIWSDTVFPKEHIVLGFRAPDVRQYTGYAVE